ncbi:Dimeric alpha-beta barrel [Penicillium cinerascens]|uniref:Dimeric alpha-beta barrel n=1 Tax=Penicillium cinerascens TaxID=70096 RepID=A0A9W9MA14_9EURO|nr:Dimeric alpha-beta barrel [Penicillium cinerascens]KAJ5195371.1 Dimeric alpha-beta barrel [Penicillium cinerascens]
MAPIERITLFKIPNEADRLRVLEQYKVLSKTATKDGKPYIVAAAVGQSIDDPRNQGFNISVKTTFASMEDMKYYDTECEAHKALKAVAGPVKEDVLTTFYENIL